MLVYHHKVKMYFQNAAFLLLDFESSFLNLCVVLHVTRKAHKFMINTKVQRIKALIRDVCNLTPLLQQIPHNR